MISACSIGRSITYLIDRQDDPHCFRLQRDRVYYVRYPLPLPLPLLFSEALLKRAENVARDNLISLGVCFGKFTKSGQFKLHVTALDYVAQFATFKVWVKPQAEMSYLYGNHILKAHLAKMTEGVPEHQGVVVYSSKDIPLGFAVTAKSAAATASLDSTAIVAFHQTDVGEYLRDEESLV